MELNVIGGGLAGLVGAIRAAELGASVDLYEAAGRLGGRGRATPGAYAAHDGPHVIYADGAMWRWLRQRSLIGPYRTVSAKDLAAAHFRVDGHRRRVPPAGLARLLARRSLRAPVDTDFASWVSRDRGDQVARWAANLSGVVTFDSDPGRLSAAFVWDRILRFTSLPPKVRYPAHGWSGLIQRLTERATTLGVRIHLDSRVDMLPNGPTIVATSLPAARRLLRDPSLSWDSGSTLLLDIAVRRRRGDAFIVSDLDEAGWCEDFSRTAPALAPAGHALVQAHLPIRAGESRDAAHARLAALVNVAATDAQARTLWRRTGSAHGRTGAVDLPGRTWRDRPAIDRGDGVYLAGDSVAAPGLLGEVAWRSAIWAAEAAVHTPSRHARRWHTASQV
jgi:phytoene dehydrogenase-like protein